MTPSLVNAEGSALLAELFNRMTIGQLLKVPDNEKRRIEAFMTANGYRFVFDRWYLQAEPTA